MHVHTHDKAYEKILNYIQIKTCQRLQLPKNLPNFLLATLKQGTIRAPLNTTELSHSV